MYWINPKKTGGRGGFPPQVIWAIAVLSGMKLWLLNLHVIIIFDVYNNWEKNFGGLYKKDSKNFAFEKIFFCKNEIENFQKFNFRKYFLSNSTFQYQISIWNDFSFHLMYILSILVKNYIFSKIFVLEAENFALSDEVTLAPCFGKNLNHSMVFEVFIEG